MRHASLLSALTSLNESISEALRNIEDAEETITDIYDPDNEQLQYSYKEITAISNALIFLDGIAADALSGAEPTCSYENELLIVGDRQLCTRELRIALRRLVGTPEN